jgi:hypothetical protein
MRLTLFTNDQATLPSDAEMDLVNRFTGGFMTDAEVADFEERLEDDEFFDRVAPLIKLWYKRDRLPIEREISQRIKVRREAGLPLLEPSHVGTIVTAVSVSALPIKAMSGVAAAAVLVAVATMERPKEAPPAPVFVQSPAPPKRPVTESPTKPAVTVVHHKRVPRKEAVVVAVAPTEQRPVVMTAPVQVTDSVPDPDLAAAAMAAADSVHLTPVEQAAEVKIDSVKLTSPRMPIPEFTPPQGIVGTAWKRLKAVFGKLPKAIKGGLQRPAFKPPFSSR